MRRTGSLLEKIPRNKVEVSQQGSRPLNETISKEATRLEAYRFQSCCLNRKVCTQRSLPFAKVPRNCQDNKRDSIEYYVEYNLDKQIMIGGNDGLGKYK